MKFKTTKKEMRQSGRDILKIGYCNAQFLLRGFNPVAYSARREGWACDYYRINGVIISTGYSPIGRKTDYNLCREYDQKALEVLRELIPWEEQREKLEALASEFVEKLTA